MSTVGNLEKKHTMLGQMMHITNERLNIFFYKHNCSIKRRWGQDFIRKYCQWWSVHLQQRQETSPLSRSSGQKEKQKRVKKPCLKYHGLLGSCLSSTVMKDLLLILSSWASIWGFDLLNKKELNKNTSV